MYSPAPLGVTLEGLYPPERRIKAFLAAGAG